MPIFVGNEFLEFTKDNEMNLTGVFNFYFDDIQKENGCNEETISSYRRDYMNAIIPCISPDKAVQTYSDDDIEALFKRIKKKNNYNQSTIDSRIRHLIFDPINKYAEDPRNPYRDFFWGSYSKFGRFNKDNPDKILFRKIRKTLTIKEEIKAFRFLLTDPETKIGQLIGLAIMFFTAIRENEACGLNWGDLFEMRKHKGHYYLLIHETSMINSSDLKAWTKTRNGQRKVPLVKVLYDFLIRRRQYVFDRLLESGMDEKTAEEAMQTMPIVCQGDDFCKRCWTGILSKAGKDFLREEIKLSEEEYAGLAQCRLKAYGTDGVIEGDVTTYLLRRNMATHLKTLGLNMKQIQYYMGHDIEGSVLKRPDYQDEDHLYAIDILLQKHPLNNLEGYSESVIVDDACELSGASNYSITLSPDHRKYLVSIVNMEFDDPIEITINGEPCRVQISELSDNSPLSEEINIVKAIDEAYRKKL